MASSKVFKLRVVLGILSDGQKTTKEPIRALCSIWIRGRLLHHQRTRTLKQHLKKKKKTQCYEHV